MRAAIFHSFCSAFTRWPNPHFQAWVYIWCSSVEPEIGRIGSWGVKKLCPSLGQCSAAQAHAYRWNLEYVHDTLAVEQTLARVMLPKPFSFYNL